MKLARNTLITYSSPKVQSKKTSFKIKECKNCYFLVEFESKTPTNSKFYTSIEYDIWYSKIIIKSYALVNNRAFEDFIEILRSETNEISAIKYGINKYITEGAIMTGTSVREWSLTDAPRFPDIFLKLSEIRSFDVLEEIQAFSSKSPEEQKEPEKEKSFFQKYVIKKRNLYKSD